MLIQEPASPPENGSANEQAGALAQLMLNAQLLQCPSLPARTLAQRLKLAWSTLTSLAGVAKGEAICAVTGGFFPGHHGDFEATIVRSRWDGILATRAGFKGIVLRAASENNDGALTTTSKPLPVDDPSHVRGSFTRNNLFQLFGRRHGVDVVVHAGSTPAARQSLARHHEGLTHAARIMGKNSGLLIPEALDFGQFCGVQLLVQSAVPGHFFEPRERTEAEISERMDLLLEALRATFLPLADRNLRPESDFLAEACERMRLGLSDTYIADLIEQVRSWQSATTVGSVLCHGDLWFPNVVFPAAEANSPGRIGLIDWEWARRDGVPGYDALHLVALVLGRVYRIPIGRTFRMITEPENLPDWATAAVASIRRTYGLSQADLEAISGLLLLIRIWQGHFVTYSGGQDWLAALVRTYRGQTA